MKKLAEIMDVLLTIEIAPETQDTASKQQLIKTLKKEVHEICKRFPVVY